MSCNLTRSATASSHGSSPPAVYVPHSLFIRHLLEVVCLLITKLDFVWGARSPFYGRQRSMALLLKLLRSIFPHDQRVSNLSCATLNIC